MASKKKHKQNKPHGHFCKVCGELKANEKFSGSGHAAHICKKCAALPVAKRNELIELRKIDNMAFRYLSKAEIEWLRGKMNDSRPEISEAARSVNNFKFPYFERNALKKGLTARSFEFYIHGDVYDEYGDTIPVHMRFFADYTGAIRRIDYNAPENELETTINIGQPAALKFLKAVVHQFNAPFWSEDMSDDGPDEYGVYDPYLDILPEYRPDYNDVDYLNYLDENEGDESLAPIVDAINKEPVCSLYLILNKGIGEKMQVFYNQLHDEPQELFWYLMEWFDPDDEYNFDDE